jgi:four helix bundle protein
MERKENVILQKTLDFALQIIDYCELLESKKKYVIARQLLKSGTSIGANIHEAQNAESKVDFVHKIKIAAKEIDETGYWLKLCLLSKHYPDPIDVDIQLLEIAKICNRIIYTSKQKKN